MAHGLQGPLSGGGGGGEAAHFGDEMLSDWV
jgi:hypothetical protein